MGRGVSERDSQAIPSVLVGAGRLLQTTLGDPEISIHPGILQLDLSNSQLRSMKGPL